MQFIGGHGENILLNHIQVYIIINLLQETRVSGSTLQMGLDLTDPKGEVPFERTL